VWRTTKMLLEVADIAVSYGTAQVLHGLSLSVGAAETVTLIGANGAGKTSCLRAISGLEPLTGGSIRFDGQRIDALSPRQRLERGLVHVPEGKRLFARMTVRENLAMGAFLRSDRSAVQSDIDAMYARFPILKSRQGQRAGSLSGGEQQILAFARGLMARPKLLLVDEPTVGLSPLMVKELSAALRAIHADGVAILLVEQNAAMALRLASRGYLLETGVCIVEDATKTLMANDYVRKAYLGI
jgi:branched-chain amino acid transport system ATP-binding protein